MTEHARLSPSDAARWMGCPGSINATAHHTDEDSDYSKEGTEAHDYLEGYLKGDPVEVRQYEFLDDVGKDAVHEAIDYILGRYTEGCQLYAERQVNPGAVYGRDDLWGTLDVSIENFEENWLEIIDYKHGQGVPVDVVDNFQLIIYAVGALHARDSFMPLPNKVRCTIIQPRCHHPDGRIRSVDYTPQELAALMDQVIQAAEKTDAPDAPLIASDKACRWCSHAKCTARAEAALAGAQAVFQPVPVQSFTPEKVLREPGQLSDEEIFMVLDNIQLIRGFLNKVEEHAVTTIKAGGKVPGFKLIPGRGQRNFAYSEEAVEKKLRNLHKTDGAKLGKRDITVTKVLSPAQLEKKIKPQVKASTWKIIEGLIVKKSGSPKLVPESDPTPGLVYSAQDIFSPIENTPELDFLK